MSGKYVLYSTAALLALVASSQSVSKAGASDFSVSPAMLDLFLPVGAVTEVPVSITVHPYCFRAEEFDVVASDPAPPVDNLTGVLINGCGGTTSTFDIRFIGDGMAYDFDLQFVDVAFGFSAVYAAIPVTIRVARHPSDSKAGRG